MCAVSWTHRADDVKTLLHQDTSVKEKGAQIRDTALTTTKYIYTRDHIYIIYTRDTHQHLSATFSALTLLDLSLTINLAIHHTSPVGIAT